MRGRLTVITVIVAAVLVVAGTLLLVSLPRRDRTPAPAQPASSSVGTTRPSSTAAPSRTSPGPTRTPGVPAGLLGKDIEVIPASQPVVALTFDAGANADGVPSILNTLAATGIKATFFLTGDFAANFPSSVRAITTAGHRIGNHTATHPHCTTLSDTALRNQLTAAENQLRAAGASDPRPLFRFPYGERDARTIATVNAAGYVSVRWTVDSLGWQGLNGRSAQQATQAVVDRVLGAARPGEIVLMHVGSNPDDHTTLDAAALGAVIDRLRTGGYRFVTLDTLLS
jgi:peptidoglycan/xylan/chitin deacetylase (PgdA/CDA1 family)